MAKTAPRFHKIRSLEVFGGGFLDGARIEFSPHLNCIIGGHGTGKTTVLEFLRFALLPGPGPSVTKEQLRQFDRLIKRNLKPGYVRVTVETKDRVTYIIERSANDEAPRVLDANGDKTDLTMEHGLFDIDAYSLMEIERIATDDAAQLELIDRFIQPQLRPLAQRESVLLHELEESGRQLAWVAVHRIYSANLLMSHALPLSRYRGDDARLLACLSAHTVEGPQRLRALDSFRLAEFEGALRRSAARVLEAA